MILYCVVSRCSSRVIYCFENHFFCCCLFSKAVLHNNVTRRKKSGAAAAVATCFCCCDTMHALFSVVVVILLAKRPFSIITKIDLNSWLLRDPRLKIKEKSESILLENYSKLAFTAAYGGLCEASGGRLATLALTLSKKLS